MGLVQLLIDACPSAAVAIAGLSLFVTGKIHSDAEFQRMLKENQFLREALETERKASTEAAQAGATTNKFIEAMVQIAAEKNPPARQHSKRTLPAISPGDHGP